MICEIATSGYQHDKKYFSRVMQKIFNHQHIYVIAMSIIVNSDSYDELMKYIFDQPYYDEIIMFCMIQDPRNTENEVKMQTLIETNERAESIYELMMTIIMRLKGKRPELTGDFSHIVY